MQIRPHIKRDGKLVPISYKELGRIERDEKPTVIYKLCNVPKDGVNWYQLVDIIDELIANKDRDKPSLFKNEAQRQRVLDTFDRYRALIEKG